MSIINYYVAFAIHPPKPRVRLESTPVPVSRNTGSNFRTLWEGKLSRCSGDWSRRSVLGRIRRRSAGSLAVVSAVPDLVFLEAMFAGTRGSCARVVLGVLIQGYDVTGMLVAKDVATFSAVMSAGEVGKAPLAGGMVANCGLGIGLKTKPLATEEWRW